MTVPLLSVTGGGAVFHPQEESSSTAFHQGFQSVPRRRGERDGRGERRRFGPGGGTGGPIWKRQDQLRLVAAKAL